MIGRLLIANRGEIACRIIATAHRLGMETIAVHSAADSHARHVRLADEAVAIGPASAAQSYLDPGRIIEAALAARADAIHPGYGFLSENADFARQVIEAGLIWVGPRPHSIEAMGLKDAAKQLMREAGVPVTPGYDGKDQSLERLAAEAEAIGYPVLIKAVAGGGGKGMRKVDRAQDFPAALESCRREARAAFGNERVLLEKYIANPRHIEVQIFGDSHGNVVHLFERDCSLQRRHQKVIEEAPAPGLDPATRERICEAAVRAGKAVDYENAGTVEFIAEGSSSEAGAGSSIRADAVYFMEMNTRLQVEHPVTEAITGIDLVEWQLRVASGEPIPLAQDEIRHRGHAIEARLYAEDPASFLPSTGRLDLLSFPRADGDMPMRGGPAGGRLRIDSGVEQGDEVTPHYDPMIAKLIAHGTSREEARRTLIEAIDALAIAPVKSNAPFLRRCLAHPQFARARITTGFIADHEEALKAPVRPSGAALARAARALVSRHMHPDLPAGLLGLRLNAPPRRDVAFTLDGALHEVELPDYRGIEPGRDSGYLAFQGACFALAEALERSLGGPALGDGAVLAPMPGKVIALDVGEGEQVSAGQRLMVIEAMKMEHALTAPFAGRVTGLNAQEGAQVEVEQLLCTIVADEQGEPIGEPE